MADDTPNSDAQERLGEWRAADRAESATDAGSVERRRAASASRRARWAFEDATRAAAKEHGAEPETFSVSMRRASKRLQEASTTSAELLSGKERDKPRTRDSAEQRDKQHADDAEIRRELHE